MNKEIKDTQIEEIKDGFKVNGEFNLNNKSIALYLHIPFCQGKCRYCDFYSVNYSPDYLKGYLNLLKKEILSYSALLKTTDYFKKGNQCLETIYFGGGTPGLLEVKQLAEILNLIIKEFSYPISDEITLEANPFSLAEEKIAGFKEIGINRLSLGVQSFNDRELKFLGRKHSAIEAEKIIQIIAKYFDNYTIDLIFAIPGQTIVDWRYTLEKAISLSPYHISLYNLQIEDGTPLAKSQETGEFEMINDSLDAEMYLLAREMLQNNGYQHYEISNFAKKDYQSRHNRIYWELEPYLGLGASAHSFTGFSRFNNYPDISLYAERLNSRKLAIENLVNLSKEDLLTEKIFMGMRLLKGLSLHEFDEEFGLDLITYYHDQIKRLKTLGLINVDRDRIKLTEKGILHGNTVFIEFLP